MPQIEQPLGRLLSGLGKGYLYLLRAKLQHLDIDRNYYALVIIDSQEGEITQQELALILDTDKVSIVRVIDYLSEKGYVERIQKTDDRRKHSLVLTAKAKLALPEIKKSFNEINEVALNGLSISQVTELSETIKKIKSNIKENV
ncbi:MAG: MarR family transcriptional regulator [Lentimicrobiaceae bacterium]|jgi:MarR family transcriptional regulator for hemolysin